MHIISFSLISFDVSNYIYLFQQQISRNWVQHEKKIMKNYAFKWFSQGFYVTSFEEKISFRFTKFKLIRPLGAMDWGLVSAAGDRRKTSLIFRLQSLCLVPKHLQKTAYVYRQVNLIKLWISGEAAVSIALMWQVFCSVLSFY